MKACCSPAATIPAAILAVLLVTVLLVTSLVGSSVIHLDGSSVADASIDRPWPEQDDQEALAVTTDEFLSTTPNKTRRSHDEMTPNESQEEEWGRLARENVMQMGSDSIRCATPRPRVIKVQESHPHAFKRFVPSCVVLHRCERESGCCDDEDHVCSPISKQRVYMYFYVVALGQQNGVASVGVHGTVERLRFANHTKCGCRRRRPPVTPKTAVVVAAGAPGAAYNIHRQGAWLVPVLLLALASVGHVIRT